MSHALTVFIALIAATLVAGFCVKLLMGIVSLAFWLTIAAIKFGLFMLIAGSVFVFIYVKLRRKKP